MSLFRFYIIGSLVLLLGACTSAPFGYAENRCTGQQNQCQANCTNIDNGPARSACIQRCYSAENACTINGYDGAGSSMAIEDSIGASKSRAEKEADYERWRAEKARERASET
ncbi:hypothetical protein ABFZ85_04990 [Hyphococcus formosus]|uniref:hypothetical protein n=1 Tax=Hyphococcus formosus TaxID=3143534 RepID=UPI00398A7930